MRTDYKNTNGLVTGVKALLKREGVPVGHWVPSGRIKGISHFYGGVEVRNDYDEVVINKSHESMERITEALDRNNVEYTVNGDTIRIPARKYCQGLTS